MKLLRLGLIGTSKDNGHPYSGQQLLMVMIKNQN